MPADLRDQHPDVVDIAPAPFLAGLQRVDQWVLAGVVMDGGVPVGRVIAAADVAADQADPQMKPHAAFPQAVLSAVDPLGQLEDLYLVKMSACRHSRSRSKRRQ